MRQRKETLLVESDEREICRQKKLGERSPAYFSQQTHPHICTNRFPMSEAALAALAGKALEMYVHIGKGIFYFFFPSNFCCSALQAQHTSRGLKCIKWCFMAFSFEHVVLFEPCALRQLPSPVVLTSYA